jgi:hypothetical protein
VKERMLLNSKGCGSLVFRNHSAAEIRQREADIGNQHAFGKEICNEIGDRRESQNLNAMLELGRTNEHCQHNAVRRPDRRYAEFWVKAAER